MMEGLEDLVSIGFTHQYSDTSAETFAVSNKHGELCTTGTGGGRPPQNRCLRGQSYR